MVTIIKNNIYNSCPAIYLTREGLWCCKATWIPCFLMSLVICHVGQLKWFVDSTPYCILNQAPCRSLTTYLLSPSASLASGTDMPPTTMWMISIHWAAFSYFRSSRRFFSRCRERVRSFSVIGLLISRSFFSSASIGRIRMLISSIFVLHSCSVYIFYLESASH